MEKEDIADRFLAFLNEFYRDDIVKAIAEGKKSIEVDFSFLDKFDVELADYLLENPEEAIAIAEDTLKQIDTGLLETKLRIRFFNLPESREIRIRNVRAEHIGKIIVVDGIVKRASEIRPEVSETVFQCPECGNNISIIQTERIIRAPIECDSCKNRKGFRLINQKLYDARWIVVEEPFEIVTGERPSELGIYLKEDLTSPRMQNKTDPGNRIKVVGILKELPKRLKGTRSRQMDIYLDAVHVESVEAVWEELEITEEDEKKIVELSKDPLIFQKLIGSLAPTMYEMDEVKEAIILQLFGGEPKLLKDGTKIRGNIHLLLIGDPASGKSQIMQLTSKLMPRGRYVSGSGISIDFDDPIIFKEGGIIRTDLIGNVCDKFYKNNESGFVSVKDLEVPVFDPKDLKIHWEPLTAVFRHENSEDLFKLTLNTGREIRVTPFHSIFTVENGKVVSKRADEIKTGDFILIPRFIPANENIIKEFDLSKEIVEFYDKKKNIIIDESYIKSKFSKHRIPRRIPVNKDLLRLIGYYIADGSLTKSKESCKIEIDLNEDETENINDIKNIFSSLFNIAVRRYKDKDTRRIRIEVKSKIIYLFFKHVLNVGTSAKTKKVPDLVFNVPPELQLEFLKGWVRGNCGVTISKSLISDVLYLFLMNGVVASFTRQKIRKRVNFGDHESYVNREVYQLKSPRVEKILKNDFSTSSIYKSVPLEFFSDERIKRLKSSDFRRIAPSAKRMLFSMYNFMLYERLKSTKNGLSTKNLARVWKINLRSARQYLNSLVKKGLVTANRKNERNIYYLSRKGENLLSQIDLFKTLDNSDFGFVKVTKIERVKPTKKFVYDLSVSGYENFIGGFGGVICHNTAAGITATVVRDEEFLGGWVLEAGALVMANRSVCAIDEFSKVSPQDRVALQEAMSLETISIAKASIVATLPAQTAILAGGNPKLGRFDPYIPIREQVDIDDVLLSRFDLRFALRDIPNPEIDTKMAEHVLRMRHFEEETKPLLPLEFLRKYIAYARSRVHPTLTVEAGERIKEFYLEMRAKAGEEAPVSITLRQYEALIRLAEASAKIRLSNAVEMEDAERAIRLMKVSLRQFGFEPETGRIDIDRAEGLRLTAAQRSRVRIMLDVIDELTNIHGKDVPMDEIISRAKAEGIDNPDEILRKMQSEGMLYSSRPGMISKV